jgi:hypothetical protein
MSAAEPPGDPDWNPDDTSGVPLSPEPEPTGAGGGGGAGGWGSAPRIEPFAIAALVWAIVSIVLPVIGTIIAFVLAAKAADIIRKSRGERGGMQYVTAARIVAGVVLALWIIGGIAFLALRDDGGSADNVAVPTQPPSTSVPLTTTSSPPLTTTTTHPLATTTTPPPPTISVVPPPPTLAPTTAPPTAPPTTQGPPVTTAPVTTKPPVTTTTTTPEQAAAKVQAKLLETVHPSNRGVPDDERFVVSYTPGQDLVVTWAINNGTAGDHPTGTPTCTSPPTTTPPTSSSSTSSTSSTTTSSTLPGPTSSTGPGVTTPATSRQEARAILQSIKPQLKTLKLDVPGVQLIGTYPIEGADAGEHDVVQVLYAKSTVQGTLPSYKKMFDVPPAEVLQCLNPAFALS